MGINDNDKNGFMSVINGLDVTKGLDIVLHTPGGDLAATESLIYYINQKFNGNVRAIIPHLAMSGGTIIACSCKEILMGKQSSLGPVDPQIHGVPASGILAEFKRAAAEIKSDQNKIHVWSPILSKYSPTLLGACENAIKWSELLTTTYLSESMFRDELLSDSEQTKKLIGDIVTTLTDQGTTKSHSRHIPALACKGLGLKIFEIEDDQELQDIILSIHHAAASTIMNTPAVKIIENHDSQSYISRYMPKPSQAEMILNEGSNSD